MTYFKSDFLPAIMIYLCSTYVTMKGKSLCLIIFPSSFDMISPIFQPSLCNTINVSQFLEKFSFPLKHILKRFSLLLYSMWIGCVGVSVIQGLYRCEFKTTVYWWEINNIRSSPLEVFLRKAVLKICSKFTGEHPCRSVISKWIIKCEWINEWISLSPSRRP